MDIDILGQILVVLRPLDVTVVNLFIHLGREEKYLGVYGQTVRVHSYYWFCAEIL
jgi:hypothetical protein